MNPICGILCGVEPDADDTMDTVYPVIGAVNGATAEPFAKSVGDNTTPNSDSNEVKPNLHAGTCQSVVQCKGSDNNKQGSAITLNIVSGRE